MLTVAEIVTRTLRFYVSQGSTSADTDKQLREKCLHYLDIVCKYIWTAAPWFWRMASTTVTQAGGTGYMPANFAQLGTQGDVYLASNTSLGPLKYIAPSELEILTQASTQTGTPYCYTFNGRNTSVDDSRFGRAILLTYPLDNSTIYIQNYVKRAPSLIDKATAPTAAESTAGNLSGAYTWLITFVTTDGETEAGVASSSLTVSSKRVSLSGIPTSPSHAVSTRNVYRTAASGTVYKLVGSISDNTTTTFTDNVADGSLGVEPPTVLTAVTGMEEFPEDWHEMLIFEGLKAYMMGSQGDGRETEAQATWRATVTKMWGEYKPEQNQVKALPRYGASGMAWPSVRSRFQV